MPSVHWKMARLLPPDDHLAILRAADSQRQWHALDDRRVCALCGRLIAGREIEILRDLRGRYTLQCPTAGCVSTANDWLYPAAETSDASTATAMVKAPSEFQFFDANARRSSFG